MWQFAYWVLLGTAVVVVLMPGSPLPVRLIAGLLGFLVWYIFWRATPPAEKGRRVQAWRVPFSNFGATPAELDALHKELLMLVGGNEQVLRNLVSLERPRHKTAADCYRAAIARLVRDRQ